MPDFTPSSLKICLAANMLWKALISYLGRSSMHKDNTSYLISLCSLMSQLKGLVLPLAMGLAERIVCRLVIVASEGLGASTKCLSCPADVLLCTPYHTGSFLLFTCVKWHWCHTIVGEHHYTQWELQWRLSHQTSQCCKPKQKCAW